MAALAAGTAALAGLLWAVAASAPAPGQAWWLLVWELAHEVATWTVAGLGLGALGLVLWSALPRRRAASSARPAPRPDRPPTIPAARAPTAAPPAATSAAHWTLARATASGHGDARRLTQGHVPPASPPAPGQARPAADGPAASTPNPGRAPATPPPPERGEGEPAAPGGWQHALNGRAGRLAGDAEDLQASCSDLSALAEGTLRTVDRLQSRAEALGRAARQLGAGSPGSQAQAAVEAAMVELAQEAARVRRMTSSQAAYGRFGAQASESLARQAQGLRADVERLTEPR